MWGSRFRVRSSEFRAWRLGLRANLSESGRAAQGLGFEVSSVWPGISGSVQKTKPTPQASQAAVQVSLSVVWGGTRGCRVCPEEA